MKKRWVWALSAILVLAIGVGVFLFSHYAVFDGQLIARNIAELDLRERELTDGQLLRAERLFPNAHIRYCITVAGQRYDAEEQTLVTGDFGAEDVELFLKFPDLRRVDVSACSSPEAVRALELVLPGTEIVCEVSLFGGRYDRHTSELALPDAGEEELLRAAEWLPELRSVTLTECTLLPEIQLSLASALPDIRFVWEVELSGRRFPTDAESLDFSGVPLKSEDLEELVKYAPLFDSVGTVVLTDTGLSEGELMAFADAHPEWKVGWERELFGVSFSTLDTELCFDDIPLTEEDTAEIEALLPYMPNLEKVVMCRCGLDNDFMEALDKAHEDVRFVWMVNVYGFGVRTDQTYFTIYNCPAVFRDNKVAEELYYCHDMIGIDLGHMHVYGDTSLFYGMPHLRYLVISQAVPRSIPELASLKELVWLEAGSSSLEDISFITELPNLRHLNIVYKRVRGDTAEKDVEMLCSMPYLERLWIGVNMYSDRQVEQLRAALPNTEIHIVTGSEIGHWRDCPEYFEMRDAMHMYWMDEKGNQVDVNPYTGATSLYNDTNPFR